MLSPLSLSYSVPDNLKSKVIGGKLKHFYCLTKICIRAKRSFPRVFSLFIVPSPFLYTARTKVVFTGLKSYKPWFMASVTVFKNGDKKLKF